MKINEVKEVLKSYTKEQIEKTLEVILKENSHNIVDIPEWLLPTLDKELKKQYNVS